MTKTQKNPAPKIPALTDMQLDVLAAMFARSNMGHGVPEAWKLRGLLTPAPRWNPNLGSMVGNLCGDLMESDEHFDMFLDEAKMWRRILKKKSELEAYRKSSPDLFAQFDAALAEAVQQPA